jgi:hypothetical protein
MIEILRDPIWQFIGAALAIAAIVLSIWIYKRQKSEKILAYEVKSNILLLSIHDIGKERLKVFLMDGR